MLQKLFKVFLSVCLQKINIVNHYEALLVGHLVKIGLSSVTSLYHEVFLLLKARIVSKCIDPWSLFFVPILTFQVTNCTSVKHLLVPHSN